MDGSVRSAYRAPLPSRVGIDLVDDLEPVLVVPLLADLDESVLQDEVSGSDVVGADRRADGAHSRLVRRTAEQRHQCGTRIALPSVGWVDGAADLDHPDG